VKCTLIIGPNHRLRGSASAVLTATHHSYGSLAYFLTFFPRSPIEVIPQPIFTQNGSINVVRGFKQGTMMCLLQ